MPRWCWKMEKKQLFLESYYDFDSLFPMEYFEIFLQATAYEYWLVYYATDELETVYGPYHESELLERFTLAPFYFEEMVLTYHLVESNDTDLRQLGVRLLKSLL